MKAKSERLLARESLDLGRELESWYGLQEIRDGLERSPDLSPYTEDSIREWHTLFNEGRQFGGRVTHSLAVAFHSRAWDRELTGDSGAERDWANAIKFWRELTQIPEFWEEMRERVNRCDDKADPCLVENLRKRLMEHLLGLHVLFIIDYADQNKLDRCKQHVRIIERAEKVPPALKKGLTQQVYGAMTKSVPEALSNGEARSALALVERFLELFPDHFFALIRAVEVAMKLVDRWSARLHWEEISDLAQRAVLWFGALSQSLEYESDPLARANVEALLSELMRRCKDRSEFMLSEFKSGRLSGFQREAALDSLEFAVQIGETMGSPKSSFLLNSTVADAFASCLNSRACYRMDYSVVELIDSLASEGDIAVKAIRRCLKQSREDLEMALYFVPNDTTIQANLSSLIEADSTWKL